MFQRTVQSSLFFARKFSTQNVQLRWYPKMTNRCLLKTHDIAFHIEHGSFHDWKRGDGVFESELSGLKLKDLNYLDYLNNQNNIEHCIACGRIALALRFPNIMKKLTQYKQGKITIPIEKQIMNMLPIPTILAIIYLSKPSNYYIPLFLLFPVMKDWDLLKHDFQKVANEINRPKGLILNRFSEEEIRVINELGEKFMSFDGEIYDFDPASRVNDISVGRRNT